nr:uncharacterized protein LOC115261611 [Aedes albopictus]
MTKINIFKIKAGSQLLDILEGSVTNSDSPDIRSAPYSNAIHRLGTFFGSRDYSFMQRQKLRSMVQKQGETDSKYVKRVIAAAKLCDFGDSALAEQVADSIQAHASNHKVREMARKFLRKGGQLGELLDKTRALEMDQLNEEIYVKSHQPTNEQAQVAAVAVQKPRYDSYNNSRPSSQGTARNNQPRSSSNWRGQRGRGFVRREYVRGATSREVTCWRCLGNRHNATECWSIQKTCHNCQRMGHVARACRRLASPGPMKRRNSGGDNEVAPPSKKAAFVKRGDDEPAGDNVSSG